MAGALCMARVVGGDKRDPVVLLSRRRMARLLREMRRIHPQLTRVTYRLQLDMLEHQNEAFKLLTMDVLSVEEVHRRLDS